MHDLIKYANECKAELDALGITYNKNITFKVNTRALQRLGLCSLNNGSYNIQISSILLEDENPIKALKNTIMHELLHTHDNCMSHGGLWQCLANRVNKAYGYNVSRINSLESLGIIKNSIKEKARQNAYVFKCDKCGQSIVRYRSSKFVRNYTNYHCGKCGGKIVSCNFKL